MQDDLAGLIEPVAWLYERGDGYYTFVETQRWEADRLGGCDNEALNYIETALYPATALETLTRENADLREKVVWQGECLRQQDDKETTLTRERDEARAEVEKTRDEKLGYKTKYLSLSVRESAMRAKRDEIRAENDALKENHKSLCEVVDIHAAEKRAAIAECDTLRTQLTATQARLDEVENTFNYLCKWVERGMFDGKISAHEAISVIAHHPEMPWKNGRWDVDHKPYAKEFYEKFPKAAFLAQQEGQSK